MSRGVGAGTGTGTGTSTGHWQAGGGGLTADEEAREGGKDEQGGEGEADAVALAEGPDEVADDDAAGDAGEVAADDLAGLHADNGR